MKIRIIHFAHATVAFLALAAGTAYASQAATDYTIPMDVIDSGGVDVSKSSNYLLSDSIGEPVVGYGASTNYILNSGYRQPSAAEFLSMTCSPNADIGSVAATGQKTGSGTCIVYTDAYNGYNLSWAILSGSGGLNTGSLISQFNDTVGPFTPTTANVPDTWSVPAGSAEWGARLRSSSADTGVEWGIDGLSEKWLNIRESSRTIVVRTAATTQSGSTEILQFRAEVGSSVVQPTGVYRATATFTLVGY